MRKQVRVWKKQEKRIIRLLYKKGFLVKFKIKELYWAEHHTFSKGRRRGGKKHKHTVYAPEVHYCTTDYWGESDEHSIVSYVTDVLYWDKVETTSDWDGESYPPSSFKYKSRNWFIKYLQKLPTVIFDSKINTVLKMNAE